MSTENETRKSPNARRALVAAIIVLFLLLLGTTAFMINILRPVGEVADTPEETGGLEWVRSIYGFGPGISEQLRTPNDVAVGPDGIIWVTDQARSRVLGFNPDGTYAKQLFQGPRNSAENALSFPVALAVDEEGLVYIADTTKDRIVVMSDDNQVEMIIPIPVPTDVAVKGDRIVVGAMSGFAIYNKDGEVIKVIGSRGKADDQFDGVQGVAIADDETIFVIDQYNNRLSAYDTEGNRQWIKNLGAPGNQVPVGTRSVPETGTASMSLPARITIDGAGRLVVADPFDFSLTVLDPKDASLIGKYGTDGSQDGQFTYPTGVDYDPARDWFAVADTTNSRVQIVRIPDSGGSAAAPVLRSLAGPLRACLIPLILLLIAAIVAVVSRRRAKKKAADSAASVDSLSSTDRVVPNDESGTDSE